MIPLGPADWTAIEAVLRTRPTDAMFPLTSLRDHGMEGDHPNATRFRGDASPPRRAVLGLTNLGMVLPFATEPEPVAAILRGRPIAGVAGPSGSVRPLMRALGLDVPADGLDADEPQFHLDLVTLRVPEEPGTLVPLTLDRARAVAWRVAYTRETDMETGSQAEAKKDVAGWIAADTRRFLVVDGAPIAMTAFNARLSDIVQVGGIYVPPAARRRGLGRCAVALHLAQAFARGIGQATLYAASEAAVACYRPLGSKRIGNFALVVRETAVLA